MIHIENLSKQFNKVLAVDHINLDVPAGEIMGFLGPNGAGKTTTIRMLAGLMRPDTGTIRIGGVDLGNEPEKAKAMVGFVPDRPYLYEKLTGWEFLQFSAGLYRVNGKELDRLGMYYLELFELLDWKDELIEGYSHGMKQRLIISSALLHKPKVFIIDEPMVGLDPRGVRLVKNLFTEMAKSRGMAVFLSTHTLAVAEEICSFITIIHKGKLIASDTPQGIKSTLEISGGNLEKAFLKLTGHDEVDGLKGSLGLANIG
ncbi:ABC transporter ATP-binding protein [Desulfomonile tiedjei]|uniref:ABC-type multidrug transport system, ATPase component n=1 Tax=Desulfomonile tiedjei (strain ATCC 49306 / DSM 6799 / DCB-1) TaxID=706587 RepID=I4CCF7_DESTA|nr:ABC transporter ATP-binding protein [Desulfomonile tiedjei]AFM27248.1 ABC-type multidrug transport system, ATPase component [Desulfomonile tiedjei DSM 6799]